MYCGIVLNNTNDVCDTCWEEKTSRAFKLETPSVTDEQIFLYINTILGDTYKVWIHDDGAYRLRIYGDVWGRRYEDIRDIMGYLGITEQDVKNECSALIETYTTKEKQWIKD